MNVPHQAVHVGWQAHPVAVAGACIATLAAAVGVALWLGAMPAVVAVLACTLAAATRMQWAALDGPALVLRNARTAYAWRAIAARRVASLRYRRSPAPWGRVSVETGENGACLVLSAPACSHPALRAITLWMIVHGRRRAHIDACLLDALAAIPEHDAARQPHDASPA